MYLRRSLSLFRCFSTSATPRARLTVGIRREDPQRIWERRSPLTPDAVKSLIDNHDIDVEFEHCNRRIFEDASYIKAGAKLKQNLENAHIIVGIKETPLDEVITSPINHPTKNTPIGRTHLMFSHTAKGQPYNTPLLAKFVGDASRTTLPHPLHPRLIDYELLTDKADGKRTVGFGWFAGIAGVLESLSSMAQSHLERGIASPFLYTPRPYTLPTVEAIRKALREIKRMVEENGTPPVLGPFVIGLTGTGNVSQGCLDILAELPIEKVEVKDIHSLVTNPNTSLKKIYLVHAMPRDYLVRLDGKPYERSHYYARPGSYGSIFHKTVAPYLTLFLNGTGWSPSFPRLMTNEQLVDALDRARVVGGARFTNIGDISCDVEGGLEFLTQATTLSSPFYKIEPHDPMAPSIQMMSVDILPASLPLDASRHFSGALLPYLKSLIQSYKTGESDHLTPALDRATIARDGTLADKHKKLQRAVDKFYKTAASKNTANHRPQVSSGDARSIESQGAGLLRKKRILMLGSGMVAGPAIGEIAKRSDVQLVVAGNSQRELETLGAEYPNIQHRVIDIQNQGTVTSLISEADVVISLLPADLHPYIAQMCIKHKKHLVTASYAKDEMRVLDNAAVAADVLLLNEIGLDPGIDHCSAIDLISKLRRDQKDILSFTSFCGGLPAPDVPHTPLRYKFSWSPKGVLLAALKPATFKLNDVVHNIPQKDLLKRAFRQVPITEKFALEGIANRDSLVYADEYGLKDARTVLRGTLRYPGFSSLMDSFKIMGLLGTDHKMKIDNWRDFTVQCIDHKLQTEAKGSSNRDSLNDIAEVMSHSSVQNALEWLGLDSLKKPHSDLPPVPTKPMQAIDLFAYFLSHKLAYEPQERDMVVLSHEIITRKRDTLEHEVHTSGLITYGTEKASAMARTVGLPVAIAALEVLDGRIVLRGVQRPTDRTIYKPVLEGMEELGLGMKETTRALVDGPTVEGTLKGGLLRGQSSQDVSSTFGAHRQPSFSV